MVITNQKNPHGFTIIEIMIVLAVSALLVVVALNFVSGDTNKTDFNISINNLKQQIEEVITQASNGYYTDNDNFKCDGTTNPVTITTGADTQGQGQNYGCILLGTVVQFNPGGNGSVFYNYPVAGNEYIGQQSPGTIDQASPVLIQNDNVPFTFTYGVKVVSMLEVDTTSGASRSTTAIGFLTSDSGGNITSLDDLSGTNSGSQSLSLYYDSASPLEPGLSTSHLAKDVVQQHLLPTNEVAICFDGGDNQSGLIKIGGATAGLSTELTVYEGGACT